jgi:hypothetical protein
MATVVALTIFGRRQTTTTTTKIQAVYNAKSILDNCLRSSLLQTVVTVLKVFISAATRLLTKMLQYIDK